MLKISEEDSRTLKQVTGWTEKDRHFLRATDGFDQVIEILDGDTVVFSGVDEDVLLGKTTTVEERQERRNTSLIAFVTCRLIHRIDQMQPIPGT